KSSRLQKLELSRADPSEIRAPFGVEGRRHIAKIDLLSRDVDGHQTSLGLIARVDVVCEQVQLDDARQDLACDLDKVRNDRAVLGFDVEAEREFVLADSALLPFRSLAQVHSPGPPPARSLHRLIL